MIIHRCVVSGELQIRCRILITASGQLETGELEIVLVYLYPNQQDLVNQNEILPGGNKLINDLKELK